MEVRIDRFELLIKSTENKNVIFSFVSVYISKYSWRPTKKIPDRQHLYNNIKVGTKIVCDLKGAYNFCPIYFHIEFSKPQSKLSSLLGNCRKYHHFFRFNPFNQKCGFNDPQKIIISDEGKTWSFQLTVNYRFIKSRKTVFEANRYIDDILDKMWCIVNSYNEQNCKPLYIKQIDTKENPGYMYLRSTKITFSRGKTDVTINRNINGTVYTNKMSNMKTCD